MPNFVLCPVQKWQNSKATKNKNKKQ